MIWVSYIRLVARASRIGDWRSPVARLLWEQEAVGSNPASPTSGGQHRKSGARHLESLAALAPNSQERRPTGGGVPPLLPNGFPRLAAGAEQSAVGRKTILLASTNWSRGVLQFGVPIWAQIGFAPPDFIAARRRDDFHWRLSASINREPSRRGRLLFRCPSLASFNCRKVGKSEIGRLNVL